jgi:hypothetical protein
LRWRKMMNLAICAVVLIQSLMCLDDDYPCRVDAVVSTPIFANGRPAGLDRQVRANNSQVLLAAEPSVTGKPLVAGAPPEASVQVPCVLGWCGVRGTGVQRYGRAGHRLR